MVSGTAVGLHFFPADQPGSKFSPRLPTFLAPLAHTATSVCSLLTAVCSHCCLLLQSSGTSLNSKNVPRFCQPQAMSTCYSFSLNIFCLNLVSSITYSRKHSLSINERHSPCVSTQHPVLLPTVGLITAGLITVLQSSVRKETGKQQNPYGERVCLFYLCVLST